jgi:hypothetical protein
MKLIKFLVSVLCALAVMQAVASAQHAGSGIGIVSTMNPGIVQTWPVTPVAPLNPGMQLVPGPTFAPIFPTFNGRPGMTHPIAPFVSAPVQPFVTHRGFPPTQAPGTIVRRGLAGPGTIVVPNVPVIVIVDQPRAVFVTPRPSTRLPVRRPPLIGSSRANVIAEWGAPSVTVLTREGETLVYTGGPTVIIQNGQVIRTK